MRCFDKINRNNMRSLVRLLAFLLLSVPVFSPTKSFSYENEKRRFVIDLTQSIP